MRLTPFRDNSSSDSSGDESTIQASTSVRVFNYDESSIVSHDTERDVTAVDPPQELEWDVVALLRSRDEPVTIDEITDEIYDADGVDDVEAWGDVHERLSQSDLPALDASGVINFHPDRGTVALVERPDSRRRNYALGALFTASLGLLFAPIALNVTALVSLLGLLVAGLGIVATVVR
jgi:hypothetical protein